MGAQKSEREAGAGGMENRREGGRDPSFPPPSPPGSGFPEDEPLDGVLGMLPCLQALPRGRDRHTAPFNWQLRASQPCPGNYWVGTCGNLVIPPSCLPEPNVFVRERALGRGRAHLGEGVAASGGVG